MVNQDLMRSVHKGEKEVIFLYTFLRIKLNEGLLIVMEEKGTQSSGKIKDTAVMFTCS